MRKFRSLRSLGPVAAFLAACSSDPVGAPDATVSGTPDAASDAGTPDTGVADSGAVDTGVPDTGPGDTGVRPDTGGFPDAGGPLDPAVANVGRWTWIPVPGSQCRSGAATGMGVKLRRDATRLFVYLEAGGACFNAQTCANNEDTFGETEFTAWARGAGNVALFGDAQANFLSTWHQVYIPYCTGDVHGGNATNKDVPGGPTGQQFVGHQNVIRAVTMLKGYLGTNLQQVVLAGSSAGGFGTFVNYATLADAFAPVPVTMISDSGPIVRDDVALSPCLEQTWVNLWNVNDGLPRGCAACTSTSGQGLEELPAYHLRTYPNGRFALVSAQQDAIIRQFWGFGSNTCGRYEIVPGARYAAALNDYRDNVLVPSGRWSTYFIPGDGHVFFRDPQIRTTNVANTPLATFLQGVIEGRVSQVQP